MGKEAVSSLIYVTVAISFNLPFSMHAKISKKNIFYKQIRSGTTKLERALRNTFCKTS